jgi:hypothetical protein
MVESMYSIEKCIEHILLDIERTSVGCQMLANEVLDEEFVAHLEVVIKEMVNQIRENFYASQEKEKLLPLINQQRIALQNKRIIYSEILQTINIQKFEASVTKALEFNTNLKLGYTMTDFLN